MFIGDVLTVSGTVTEVNETFREITVKAVITNQNGQKVTRGVIPRGRGRLSRAPRFALLFRAHGVAAGNAC